MACVACLSDGRKRYKTHTKKETRKLNGLAVMFSEFCTLNIRK
jgi:hypothetical protein